MSRVPYDEQPAYAYDIVRLNSQTLDGTIEYWKGKNRSRLSDENNAKWVAKAKG